MKKVSLFLAMVFAVTLAMAQNTATTSVTGSNNDSDVNQQGDLQTATVTQDGDHNVVDVDQDNTADSPSEGQQTATITQDGNYNDAQIDMNMQKGNSGNVNSAVITQDGNLNKSTQKLLIDYNNKQNDVEGYQEGDNNELTQIIEGGYVNSLEAKQYGQSNTSYQVSEGMSRQVDGEIMQNGNYNEARQYGKGSAIGGFYGSIKIHQIGDRNIARQDMEGNNEYGEIYQTGNWNESRQVVSGQMDETFVEIDGDHNFTRQDIDGGSNGNVDPSNVSEVFIDGNSNDVRTAQVGSFNTTKININGGQYGHHDDANNNDVDVDQIGDYNMLSLGIPRGDIGGDFNTMNADQTGNGHLHRISISGSHNDVTIDADGNVDGSQYSGNKGDWSISDGSPVWSETSDYNELYLKQDGEQNFATGSVAGDQNDIDIRQTGTGNMVGSTWYAGDGVIISGNSNIVDIDQMGSGNSSMNTVTGNANSISVFQSN